MPPFAIAPPDCTATARAGTLRGLACAKFPPLRSRGHDDVSFKGAPQMRSLCALTLLGVAVSLAPAQADPVTVTARAMTYRPTIQAWARVEAVAPLVLRTSSPARVLELRVVPGQSVAAGERLAQLAGPRVEADTTIARARLRAAQGELIAAQQGAASAKRTYPVVTNRQALAAAEAALAAAQGKVAEARAELTALGSQEWLSSPVAAVVSDVEAASGTDLPAGAAVITLLPQGQLWLRAEVFDATPITAASEGRFTPADGTVATTVRAVAELPARAANGARVIDLAPRDAAAWQVGEAGELILHGAPRTAVAVPASALVLDAGKWFVLTDTAGKLAAQRVTPGPARGVNVLVTTGLRAGVPVVVRQAYLLYHRQFAAQYTPPD